MKHFRRSLLGLLCLVATLVYWPTTADAQTFVCPSGPGPGEIQVGTTGGSGGVAVIPICASNGEDSSAEDPVVWEKRWGAVAAGGNGWGAATDMRSERQAKKVALEQCKKTETRDTAKCKTYTYYNQCVVVVIATDAPGFFLQRAVDLPTAASLGLGTCKAEHAECQIFYSGCSHAKRVN